MLKNRLRMVVVGAVLLVALASTAHGADAKARISQLGHSVWRVQDGVLNAAPNVTAQTKDGFVWIGTETGLLRFDGVRFTRFAPAGWAEFNDLEVTSLFVASDGTLWIGTPRIVGAWKNGRLTSVSVNGHSNAIVEDHQGRIWVSTSRSHTPLCEISTGKARCFGAKDGLPFPYGGALRVDEKGDILLASAIQVVKWSPERGLISSYTFESLRAGENLHGISGLLPNSDGSSLVSIGFAGKGLGLQQVKDGSPSAFSVPGLNGNAIEAQTAYRDKQGSLWIGTYSDGMYRVTASGAEHYTERDGLSGDSVRDFQEDREGNIWVSTDGGVDMFRDLKVVSWSSHEGLPSGYVSSVLAARDGSVLIGTHSALEILRHGTITTVGEAEGLPGKAITALLQDLSGRYWMGVGNQLAVYDGHHFTTIKRPGGQPTGTVFALALDSDGGVWASVMGPQRQVLHIKGTTVDEVVPLEKPTNVVVGDGQSGFWVPGASSIGHYSDGHMSWVSVPLNGSAITGMTMAKDGSILAINSQGLWELKAGRVQLLGRTNGLPCQTPNGLAFTAQQAVVLRTACGLIEISREDLQTWWSNAKAQIPYRLIDSYDGARLSYATFSPQMSLAPDGRIWLANEGGIQVFDPDHLSMNSVIPPVHIEEIIADHIQHDLLPGLALPPLTRDIEIQYTALSFSVPQKVRFRYMLEGHDTTWQDAGPRREAFYQDLRPAKYRFHVAAANNDGVWNNDGDVFEFLVKPAWFQTLWFRTVAITCMLLLVWAIYRVRVRYIARAISGRFDERLAERTRVARQLHDTLLQTVQGSKMIADDALVPGSDETRMRGALVKLSGWLAQATQEGREALHSLRVSIVESNHLADSLRRAAESLPGAAGMLIEVTASGAPRDLHPIVRDEIFQIAFEAVRNAIQHSQARLIDVEIVYAKEFMLSVKDNGIGMDSALVLSGRSGHFGLTGMRERASRISGKLRIVGGVTGGTEVVLTVSGSVAYRKNRVSDL